MFSPTDSGWETLIRSVPDIPGLVMLLCAVKSVSTPVVLGVMIHVRKKEVPALRVELRLRRKVKGEMGAGTV